LKVFGQELCDDLATKWIELGFKNCMFQFGGPDIFSASSWVQNHLLIVKRFSRLISHLIQLFQLQNRLE